MDWELKPFDDLTPAELYAVLQLRNEIFVVEQNCVFQDADNKDQYCHHLMGWVNNKLIAYTRIVPPGIAYKECSIGRVVVSATMRGKGIAQVLMQKSIAACHSLYGIASIRIGAQLYLEKFYSSFGFKPAGDVYLEDEIKHVPMLLDTGSK